jgi:2',3'-cyclic-nucleotide 2'-phosphodiesterase (5'-nucleotidase family)
MKRKINAILLFSIGAGLWACSSVSTISMQTQRVAVDQRFSLNSSLDSLIQPYKDSLNREMDEIIAHSSIDFSVSRPNSNLGNWFTDAIFINQTRTVRMSEPIFCLFNTGGIRSTLNKGAITLGDMFKLMPFENEIVWVRMPAETLSEIEVYLQKSGGEPISNAKMIQGKLELSGWSENTTHFWVITSDYLMNGGDRMTFFENKTSINLTGKLLRDALIQEAKEQGELKEDTTDRISF